MNTHTFNVGIMWILYLFTNLTFSALLTAVELHQSLSTMGGLTILLGVIFVLVADSLSRWQPTQLAGRILQDRVFNAKVNWQTRPSRSLFEIVAWLGEHVVISHL